jgi:orotidine-5'-phosphate decarboxylase
MKDFQYQELTSGKRLYDVVGERMADLAAEHHGSRGYGDFGIVVGCTEKEEAANIRHKYPHLFFLIPGYGTQGGAGEDAARLLIRGNGGVVNASRSILCAWKKTDPSLEKEQNAAKALEGAAQAALEASLGMRFDIQRAVQTQDFGECNGCEGLLRRTTA